jgi:hypothetical protein
MLDRLSSEIYQDSVAVAVDWIAAVHFNYCVDLVKRRPPTALPLLFPEFAVLDRQGPPSSSYKNIILLHHHHHHHHHHHLLLLLP